MLVPLRCHGSFSCIGNTGVWSAFNSFSWCIEGVVVSRCTRVTTSVISQDYKLSRCLLGDIPPWSSSETSSKRLHLLGRATAVTSKTCQIVGFFLGPRALQLFPSSPITSPAHHSPFYQSREDTPTAPLSISFTFPNLYVSFPSVTAPHSTPPSSISPDFHAPCLTFYIHMQARLLCISTPLFQRSIARSISTQLKPQSYIQPIINKRKYTMAQAMHGHSAACCNIPPIISKGYEPKGRYETIGGLKTCKFRSIPPHPDPHLHLYYQLLTNRTNRRHRPSQCL